MSKCKQNTNIITSKETNSEGMSRRTFLGSSISVALITSSSLFPARGFSSTIGQGLIKEMIIFTRELTGFTGATLDPVTNQYQLGNGYRSYNSALMRFHSPDSLSPFGKGGINAYAYCQGDPINLSDPSGHFSWSTLLFGIGAILVGIIGAAMAPFTGGTSFMIAMAVIAGVSGAIGGVLQVASTIVEDSNPQASANLNWASIGFAVASMAFSVAGASQAVSAGAKLANRATNFKTAFKWKWGKSAKAWGKELADKMDDVEKNAVQTAKTAKASSQTAAAMGRQAVRDKTLISSATESRNALQYRKAMFGVWKVEKTVRTSMSAMKASKTFGKAFVFGGINTGVFLAAKVLGPIEAKANADKVDPPQSSGSLPSLRSSSDSTYTLNGNSIMRAGIFGS